MVQSRANV